VLEKSPFVDQLRAILQSIPIDVPFTYRTYMGVFRAAMNRNPYPETFVWTPYEEYWIPPTCDNQSYDQHQRIYSDFYTSPLYIEEDQALQASCAAPPGCTLPKAILPWAESSDGTHLAQHSAAKATPAYGFLLNQPKALRSKLSARCVETTHFFPEV